MTYVIYEILNRQHYYYVLDCVTDFSFKAAFSCIRMHYNQELPNYMSNKSS